MSQPLIERSRAIGRAAWVAGWVALVLGPVHALSRYATAGGAEDLELPGVRAWAEPSARVLEPILSWSDADFVYRTYGKVWFFIVLAVTLCAFVIWRGRVAEGLVRGVEKVGWWIALPGYALLTVGLLGIYWTPFLDEIFTAVGVPAMLVSLLGSLVLGIGLLRRRFRPLATGILLVASLPLFFVISDLIALGAALTPMFWAWGLAGRRISVPSAVAVPVG